MVVYLTDPEDGDAGKKKGQSLIHVDFAEQRSLEGRRVAERGPYPRYFAALGTTLVGATAFAIAIKMMFDVDAAHLANMYGPLSNFSQEYFWPALGLSASIGLLAGVASYSPLKKCAKKFL